MSKNSADTIISQIDRFKLLTVCRNLIKLPSYPGQEKEKGEYVTREMERLGLEVTEVSASRDRSNIIGVLRGEGTGKSLMLCAHLDTHWPLESQEQMAHSGEIKDGAIYGLGTGDSMAPMAAIFAAVDAVKKVNVKLKGDVIFTTTVDEMTYALGARVLIENGIKADMCLIGEPTDFNIGIVHSGRAEAEISVRGKSLVEAGPYAKQMGLPVSNAVISMNKVIGYLLQMEKEDPYFHQKHPLLPGEGGAFYIGSIIGGSAGYGSPTRKPGFGKDDFGVAKIPPTYCTLKVGVRYWPGQTAENFVSALNKWVSKAKREDPSVESEVKLYLDDPPAEISENEEIVTALRKSVRRVVGKEPKIMGNVYWTEAGYYDKARIPTAWCGPPLFRFGSPDEHITFEELTKTCQIYAGAILNVCGGMAL